MGISLPEFDATVLGGAGDAVPVPTQVPRRPRVWPIFVTMLLAVLATMGEAIALLIIQGWRPSSPDAGPALDARTIEWLLVSTELTLVAAALIAARPFSAARLGLAQAAPPCARRWPPPSERWPLPPNVTSVGAVIMFALAAAADDVRRLPRRGGGLWGRSSTDPS
jgi:hypothetical protein